MLSIDFDPTRSVEDGQYHVRLIDTKSGDYGSDAKRQNQLGYWCDREHLVHVAREAMRYFTNELGRDVLNRVLKP
jgi:hypothetical protein